ncbi:MAG: DUF2842 domain-containing protein [Tabrizicola sp.]
MAHSYKARRRWALVILLVGLPVYLVAAVTLVGLIERPSMLVELAIYVGLGFAWALPFRFIFRGIGQPDPDQAKTDGQGPSV